MQWRVRGCPLPQVGTCPNTQSSRLASCSTWKRFVRRPPARGRPRGSNLFPVPCSGVTVAAIGFPLTPIPGPRPASQTNSTSSGGPQLRTWAARRLPAPKERSCDRRERVHERLRSRDLRPHLRRATDSRSAAVAASCACADFGSRPVTQSCTADQTRGPSLREIT